MTAARVVLAVLVFGSLSACATDLLIGEDTDTDAGTTMEPVDTGEPDPTIATTTGETTDPDPTTTGATPDDSTSTGDEPDPSTTSGTTEGETEGGESTTGEPKGCGAIGDMEPCTLEDECMWVGEPKLGECTEDPCFMPMGDCVKMNFKLCVDAPACAWNSENPELGDCLPLQCVPCELLDELECNEVEGCMFEEAKMACVEAV